jgi:hypothetical protein
MCGAVTRQREGTTARTPLATVDLSAQNWIAKGNSSPRMLIDVGYNHWIVEHAYSNVG